MRGDDENPWAALIPQIRERTRRRAAEARREEERREQFEEAVREPAGTAKPLPDNLSQEEREGALAERLAAEKAARLALLGSQPAARALGAVPRSFAPLLELDHADVDSTTSGGADLLDVGSDAAGAENAGGPDEAARTEFIQNLEGARATIRKEIEAANLYDHRKKYLARGKLPATMLAKAMGIDRTYMYQLARKLRVNLAEYQQL